MLADVTVVGTILSGLQSDLLNALRSLHINGNEMRELDQYRIIFGVPEGIVIAINGQVTCIAILSGVTCHRPSIAIDGR